MWRDVAGWTLIAFGAWGGLTLIPFAVNSEAIAQKWREAGMSDEEIARASTNIVAVKLGLSVPALVAGVYLVRQK
ncbi:hypothetical protein [Calidithermus timidus]|jgi:hypothetical protein|uniref:hypothetical protein n=1 Tax=Calidithermus timidus TaxID=307124 RepID=UPI000371FD13|nr:hypothetical protein [Calidithermus timidus]